jgi:amino acid transporter
VAYEGFELIPNALNEMENPHRDLGNAIFISIAITTVIYIIVSLVAVGNLMPEEISRYKEYALAVAARPFLGKAGFMLVSLGALLSTASAINATLFGTARLGMVMAQESELPQVFSHKERTKDIPYISLLFITATSVLFVNTTDLTIISSFASSIFLLVFAAINLSAIRLRKRISMNMFIPLAGILLSLASWVILCVYLFRRDLRSLIWIGALYLCVIVAELFFSERKLFFKRES